MSYYRERRRPKIVQLLQAPTGTVAVFQEQGKEVTEPVHFLALYDDGDTAFLTADKEGILEQPDTFRGFKEYRFDGEK